MAISKFYDEISQHDFNVRAVKEAEIRTSLQRDNGCDVMFDYVDSDSDDKLFGPITLYVYTCNVKHKFTFLMDKFVGNSFASVLDKVRDYIGSNDNDKYSVEWFGVDRERHTSYFSGKSMKEVMDKFYSVFPEGTVKIFSVNLVPIS
jgi:hypothetical protein